MYVAYLGRPQSRLGQTGTIVAAIVQAGVALTMATVQIVMEEIRERRARKQWEKDQASAATQAQAQAAELTRQNAELRAYLDSIVNPQPTATATTGVTGAVTGLMGSSPYMPYVVIGGVVLVGILLLKRRD